jgi:hypothetical protein
MGGSTREEGRTTTGGPVRLQGTLAGDLTTGAVAQLIAGVAFTPLDVVKERMQVRVCVHVCVSELEQQPYGEVPAGEVLKLSLRQAPQQGALAPR